MNNEVVLYERERNEDLPVLINDQVYKLADLDQRIQQASLAAENALKKAKSASDLSAGFGKKKAAIEELQEANLELANAVQSGTEAQKVSFDFQMKLAEITKYLFGLGMSNIANNRTVVRELELRLKGASEDELSDLARAEMMSVIQQLNEQQDLLRKLEKNVQNVQQVRTTLHEQFDYARGLNERLFEHQFTLEEVDKTLGEQKETYTILHHQLKQQAVKQEEKWSEQQHQNTIIKDQISMLSANQQNQQTLISSLNEQFTEKLSVTREKIEAVEKEAMTKMLSLEQQQREQLQQIENYAQNLTTLQKRQQTSADTSAQQIANQAKTMTTQAVMIAEQKKQIDKLHSHNEQLETALAQKTNATFSKLTFGVALTGVIAAIVSFFI